MPDYKLRKRNDSPYWFITWTEGRRSKRVTTGTADRERAQGILAEFILEATAPVEAKPAELGVSQVLGWYWDEWASKRPSKDQAKIAINRFREFYGTSPLTAIDAHSHARYLAKRTDEKAAWQTINRERMVLRAALNHARKHHGLMTVPHVPTIRAEDPEAAPVEPKGRPLSIKELAKLYAAAKSDHIRTFFLILLGTMCRPDAARELRIKDQCDFEHRLIHLNPKTRKQTKKRRPIVPMASFLYRALKGQKRAYGIEYHGGPIGSTKTAWRLLRESAGLGSDVNPYSIRHTVSRELRRRKVPGDQVSIMLGHRPVNASRTDLIYAPYEPGYCREAVRAIEALYRDIMREVARHPRAKRGVDKHKKESFASGGNSARIGTSGVVGATGIEPVTPTMSRKGKPKQKP